MIEQGAQITVWMHEPLAVPGSFTGTFNGSDAIGLLLVRDGERLGEYEGVFVPWYRIRYVTFPARRPR